MQPYTPGRGGGGKKKKLKGIMCNVQVFFLIISLVVSPNQKEAFFHAVPKNVISSLLTANSQSRTRILLLVLKQQKFLSGHPKGRLAAVVQPLRSRSSSPITEALYREARNRQRATAGIGKCSRSIQTMATGPTRHTMPGAGQQGEAVILCD